MNLVFLNGWAASSSMLEIFAFHLPDDYEFTVLDDLYQLELADIILKIDELITEDTVLAGWSLGGMLALYYAGLSTNKVQPKALVLFNSSACFLEKHDFICGVKRTDFDALKQVVIEQDTKALLRLFSHLLVGGSASHKEDRRLLKQVFNAGTLPDWAVLTKGLAYLETLDLRYVLGSIRLPTLCVLGEKDVLVSASSKSYVQNENVKFDVVSGVGHFPFGVFSEKLSDVLVNYVRSLNECY